MDIGDYSSFGLTGMQDMLVEKYAYSQQLMVEVLKHC